MTFLYISFFIVIMVFDLLWRRVPNRLLLLALVVHAAHLTFAAYSTSVVSIGDALAGFLFAFALLIPFYLIRIMGAGDVKFFAMLGLILGTHAVLPIFIIASSLAATHALIFYWASSRYLPQQLERLIQQIGNSKIYRRLRQQRKARSGIPYAAYLALPAIVLMTR